MLLCKLFSKCSNYNQVILILGVNRSLPVKRHPLSLLVTLTLSMDMDTDNAVLAHPLLFTIQINNMTQNIDLNILLI